MLNRIESVDVKSVAKTSSFKNDATDPYDIVAPFADYMDATSLNKSEDGLFSNNKVNIKDKTQSDKKNKMDDMDDHDYIKKTPVFYIAPFMEQSIPPLMEQNILPNVEQNFQLTESPINEIPTQEFSTELEHTHQIASDDFCIDGDSDYIESASLSESIESILNEKVDLKVKELINLRSQNGLFVERNTPSSGSPMPFLAPIAFLNVEQSNHHLSSNDDFSNPFSVESAIKELSQANSKENNGSSFQNFSQDKQQEVQTKIIQTPQMLAQTAQQFVQNVKDQFEKFKASQDKKVTLHLRDGKKNLTMIFDMKGENDIGVIFRTTDMDWKNMLEDQKSAIFEALKDTNYNLDIRYLGE